MMIMKLKVRIRVNFKALFVLFLKSAESVYINTHATIIQYLFSVRIRVVKLSLRYFFSPKFRERSHAYNNFSPVKMFYILKRDMIISDQAIILIAKHIHN